MASDPGGYQYATKGRGFASISNLVPATKVYDSQNVHTSRTEENNMNICNVNSGRKSPLSEQNVRVSHKNWKAKAGRPPNGIGAGNRKEFQLIFDVVNNCEFWQNSGS